MDRLFLQLAKSQGRMLSKQKSPGFPFAAAFDGFGSALNNHDTNKDGLQEGFMQAKSA